ncbi:MAG TPA: GDSL-type esterase/lipase family protein [Frankiaceae bacterium]|nr:GDSL-type esterase/lipase family protein [Frankiaceae bacterium]
MRRVAVLSILAVAAAGGGGAWAAGLFHAKAAEHSAVVTPKNLPAAVRPAARRTPDALLADSSPWRTTWALSLDHDGVTTGTDLSCRIVAHISLSGSQVRFRLINYPSTTPVTFSHLVAAVRTTGLDVDPATQHVVTVHGAASLTLPANGDVTTDPVSLPVQRGQDVTLSVALSTGNSAPWHYWSSQSSGCTPAGAGDTTTSAAGLPFSERSEDRWLSEVQVLPTASVPTLAVYGDSITDGLFLPVDTSARWTDQLEAQTGGRLVALNFGVAGDRITGQAPVGQLPGRVATDVLAPRGVSAVMVEMGSNDIKAGVSAQQILAEIQLMAAKVEAAHETLIVATVPGRGDGLTAEQEQQRQVLNASLRQYPIVADIDAALTDPATGIIRADYDAGDHIHPNPLGVAAMTPVLRAAIAKVPGALGAAAR